MSTIEGKPVERKGRKIDTAWCWTCGHCGMSEYLPSPKVIRGRREALGVSLREFARRAKLSASHVSDIETGRKRPSFPFLRRLAQIEAKVKGGGGWTRT